MFQLFKYIAVYDLNIFQLGTMPGLSIFFQFYQYFTFYQNLNNFHGYLIQHSLKSGGTKDHFRQEKVPGTTPYWKDCYAKSYFELVPILDPD
jgi:hypothetical protein